MLDASTYFVRLIIFDPDLAYSAGYVLPCDSRLVDATGSVSDIYARSTDNGGGITIGTIGVTFEARGPNYDSPLTLGTSTIAETWGGTGSGDKGFNDTFSSTITDVDEIIPAGNIIRARCDAVSTQASLIRLTYLLQMSRHSRS